MAALASCWVHMEGEWWPAEAIAFADDEAQVRFVGFPWRQNRWLLMPRHDAERNGGEGSSTAGSSSRDAEGEEDARLSFDEPPRCRRRQPSKDDAAAKWRDDADDIGLGSEVIILRSGALRHRALFCHL